MRFGIIYEIRNLVNLDRYIGSSINPKSRKREHFNSLSKNTHHSIVLQRAFNKYGKDSFQFIVIEEQIPYEILREREDYWIKKLNPKYNIYQSATRASNKDFNFTEDTKTKIALGHKQSDYTVFCLNNGKTYNTVSEASRDTGVPRDCIANIFWGGARQYKGWVFFKNGNNGWDTLESYLEYMKTSTLQKCKDSSRVGKAHPKSKGVIMLDKDDKVLKTYDSIRRAAIDMGTNNGANISSACRGILKSAYGYKWKFS